MSAIGPASSGKRPPEMPQCDTTGTFPLGLAQPEALQVEKPRLPERAGVGLDRYQVEPAALERCAAKAAGDEMRRAGRPRLARRIIDAQAGAPERRRANAQFADLGALWVQRGPDQAAEPQLLGIGHLSARGKSKRQQKPEME